MEYNLLIKHYKLLCQFIIYIFKVSDNHTLTRFTEPHMIFIWKQDGLLQDKDWVGFHKKFNVSKSFPDVFSVNVTNCPVTKDQVILFFPMKLLNFLQFKLVTLPMILFIQITKAWIDIQNINFLAELLKNLSTSSNASSTKVHSISWSEIFLILFQHLANLA